ncbi:hypothetical protein D5E80_25200 [Vibrio parahaemolyticus]|nr:hypothetical protein D5E80_25200 [Vibrio parahaemolyticus]
MFKTPRDVEVRFKNSLGAIGPLMCVADIAANELVSNNDNQQVTSLSRAYNHKNLNLEKVDLSVVSLYVNLAHVAYINSRAELFCDNSVEFIKEHTGNSNSYNIDSIDFLRKAVFQIHVRKHGIDKKVRKLDESIYLEYIGKEELTVIDYFRKMRNVEFHGGVQGASPVGQDENELIYKRFKHRLNPFHEIAVRDVILYSQAWQSAAKNICSNLVDIDNELLGKLLTRYSNYSDERKNNAIAQKLEHDYLQPKYVVNTLKDNGWVA